MTVNRSLLDRFLDGATAIAIVSGLAFVVGYFHDYYFLARAGFAPGAITRPAHFYFLTGALAGWPTFLWTVLLLLLYRHAKKGTNDAESPTFSPDWSIVLIALVVGAGLTLGASLSSSLELQPLLVGLTAIDIVVIVFSPIVIVGIAHLENRRSKLWSRFRSNDFIDVGLIAIVFIGLSVWTGVLQGLQYGESLASGDGALVIVEHGGRAFNWSDELSADLLFVFVAEDDDSLYLLTGPPGYWPTSISKNEIARVTFLPECPKGSSDCYPSGVVGRALRNWKG